MDAFRIVDHSATLGTVEFWSSRRLPFESHALWAREAKAALRDALRRLPEGDGVLGCLYASTDTGLCDAENVLLYNLGAGTWLTSARSTVRFERSTSPPPAPPQGIRDAGHYHLYACRRPVDAWWGWQTDSVVACFRAEGLDRLPPDVAGCWLAIRSGEMNLTGHPLRPGDPFGLRITVRTSAGRPHPLPVTKKLVDAAVCAFHVHSGGTGLAEAAHRIAERLGTGASTVLAALNSDQAALLGPADMVRPYRDYVQWNPADDRCAACEINASLSGGGGWTLEGEIYSIRRTPWPQHPA